jgi:hypothetical protein
MVITGRTSMNSKAMGPESERFAPSRAQLSDFAGVYSMERGPALENAGHPSANGRGFPGG